MQKLVQTTSASRTHHVHKIHTFITVKGPGNSAVPHATTALAIKARKAGYLVFFMFKHNLNKHVP